jgi:hypothetical protein
MDRSKLDKEGHKAVKSPTEIAGKISLIQLNLEFLLVISPVPFCPILTCPISFLCWGFFCRFLLQDGSRFFFVATEVK